jgi:hypothetical protein
MSGNKNAAKRERETLIPPPMKPAKKAPIGLHLPDVYEERRSAGTEFAEKILAMRPAKPPQRRSA